MKKLLNLLPLLLIGVSAMAQTQPAPATPPAVVTLITDVTGKQFTPDTAFAALSEEDVALLAKQPVANWGLPMESGKNMSYYNLVVGTRSYQLVITKAPTAELPTATLLRFTTP